MDAWLEIWLLRFPVGMLPSDRSCPVSGFSREKSSYLGRFPLCMVLSSSDSPEAKAKPSFHILPLSLQAGRKASVARERDPGNCP